MHCIAMFDFISYCRPMILVQYETILYFMIQYTIIHHKAVQALNMKFTVVFTNMMAREQSIPNIA